jgi:hypothetical protein
LFGIITSKKGENTPSMDSTICLIDVNLTASFHGLLYELHLRTIILNSRNRLTLGEKLALPPFLEPRRADIEAKLRPLELESK